MLGPRHLKRIGTSYNSPAAQAITADVISGDSAIKRHRKQKYTNLKQLPYTEGKEETDEDFQATGDDGISNRVASHQHNRSAEEEDLEDSPAPGPRTRRGSAGGKSQRNPLTMSPDTASTTSTPASNDSDVVPRSQHVGPSDTYPAADPSAAGTSQPATQLDGVSAAQESAPQLTQLEGVAISEAQLPSPIAHASRPELQDTLDAPQQHKPQTTKYTQGRPGSQNSPQLTRAQLIPAGENVQPGVQSTSPHNATVANASPQRLTRSAAQQQAAELNAPSPGRPPTRVHASNVTQSTEKVAQRFKSKARDQASTGSKSAAGPSSGSARRGATSDAPALSPARTVGLNALTESQLRHIAHPAAKPAHKGKLRSPAQPVQYEAVIPFAESEEEEPAAPDAAGCIPMGGVNEPGAAPQADAAAPAQPAREVQRSNRDPVTSQNFVADVAARVEQLGLWLRYGPRSVRVVAAAVVDVMRVQTGQVYRHKGAPVLLMCSDAQTTAQFAASLRCGCLERDGAFLLLQNEEAGCSSGGNQQEQPEEDLHGDQQHVVPVIMLQACEPGAPQKGDILVEDVEERLQQGGVHATDNFASLRWLVDAGPDQFLSWGGGEHVQREGTAAVPSTSRGALQEVQAPRLGRMNETATHTVGARNTDTPDREGAKQPSSAWGSPMKPPMQHCLSREPSAPVLQPPPAARANMHGKSGTHQQGRAGGKRGLQQGGTLVGAFVSAAGQATALSPEKKRARSDLEAIWDRYPNLAELKKPEYAERLATMCDMWYGSPAMREYGQMAWFILAYYVTGYPIECFRHEKQLNECDDVTGE